MLLTFSATAQIHFSYRLLGLQRQLQTPMSQFCFSVVAQIPQQHLPKPLLSFVCLAPLFMLTVSRWQPHITKLTRLQIPSPSPWFFLCFLSIYFTFHIHVFFCSTNQMELLGCSLADYLIHLTTSGESEQKFPAPLIHSGECKDEHTLHQSLQIKIVSKLTNLRGTQIM